MTTVTSNSITGITTLTASTDVANKEYVDNKGGSASLPSQTGNAGKFLTTTDGTSTSWDYVSNYQEFTSTGEQTFTVPSYSNVLLIEAVGAGGGGNSGVNSLYDGVTWTLRTSTTTNIISKLAYAPGQTEQYFSGGSGNTITTSTNGIQWTMRTSGAPAGGNIHTVTFATGASEPYLYGTNNIAGAIATSTNGIQWTLRTTGMGAVWITTIAYGSNQTEKYVTGDSNAQVISSTNAIEWTQRTSGGNLSYFVYGNNFYVGGGPSGRITTSSDAIHWEIRTLGNTSINCTGLVYAPGQTNAYAYISASGFLATSTDVIHWTSRTTGTIQNLTDITFIDRYYVVSGTSGLIIASTDAISWSLRTSGTSRDLNTIIAGNNILLTAGFGDAGLTSAVIAVSDTSLISGRGGSSGSYTSWYVPKAIVTSNITVNPGVGGTGGTSSGQSGSAGAGTTVSWTGPGGNYTITASGGGAGGVAGAAQLVTQSSFYYTTAGLAGAVPSAGVGNTATAQTNQFQPTGGGSGAGTSLSSGGSGGTINVYGISTSASGGTTSFINGTVGFAYTGLPYGSGGGGGGTGDSTAGNGGNGARGGGGGGGASNTAAFAFGNGGNGGDGYVKITWW